MKASSQLVTVVIQQSQARRGQMVTCVGYQLRQIRKNDWIREQKAIFIFNSAGQQRGTGRALITVARQGNPASSVNGPIWFSASSSCSANWRHMATSSSNVMKHDVVVAPK